MTKPKPKVAEPVFCVRPHKLSVSAREELAQLLSNDDLNAINRASYLDERREMMQQWADMLDVWKKGEVNVMPIKRNAA